MFKKKTRCKILEMYGLVFPIDGHKDALGIGY